MDKKKALSTMGKAAVSAIPFVGGSIASLWSDLESSQIERKISRFVGLVETLQSDFEVIKDKVNQDFVSASDCQDIFEKMSKLVINERVEEKRLLYKNAYLNSMTSTIVDFDALERNLRLIEQLNTIEIHLLRLFDNPKLYNKNVGNIIRDPFIDANGNRLSSYMVDYFMLEQIMRLLPREIKKDDVYESILFLTQNRIIKEGVVNKQLKTNGNPISIFDDVLTDKGKSFVKQLKSI